MRLFIAGEVLSATQVAEKVGRDFDGVSKHLKLMRAAGVICVLPGGDKRCAWYHIPKQYRTEPGMLDYGWCRFSVVDAPSRAPFQAT